MINDNFGKTITIFIIGTSVILILLIIEFGRMSIESKKKCELSGGNYSSSFRYGDTVCLKKDSLIEIDQ